MKRHCSVCGLPGHDRRKHGRRNMQAFTDRRGIVHPIRAANTEKDRLVQGLRAKERAKHDIDSTQQQAERRWPEYGETMRRARKLEELEEKADALREDLRQDKAYELVGLMRRRGKERGEVNRIPYEQARPIFRKFLGREPEHYRTSTVTDHGHRYLRWEYVLDELAEGLGYRSSEALKRAVERVADQAEDLERIEREISTLKAQLENPRRRPSRRRPATKRRRK